MVEAADNGDINLSDYWAVGDTRTVHLSAMSKSTGINETHVAQDVELVLMDTNHFTLKTPTASGRTTNSFVIGMKDCLIEYGKMNTTRTNAGGWNNSPRRTWCNTVFKNAIPSTLLPIFKQFKVKASAGNKSTDLVESVDWFSLPCISEAGLTYAYAVAEEGTTIQWYNTSSNRIKKLSSSGSANYWWTRSPDTGYTNSFCFVLTGGTAADGDANGATVMAVTDGGPAAQAGIPTGAVVTEVDGRVIASGDALIAAVRSHAPGDQVSVKYTQGGNEQTVQVTLGTAPSGGN
jgi:hypothetical protein